MDQHQDKEILKHLVKRAKKKDVDFIVCGGDVSWFGRGLRDFLEAFSSVDKKMYIIPGNHEEDVKEWDKMISSYPNIVNLHKKDIEIENYVLLGYGGGGFAMQDPEFRKLARKWYGKYNGKKIILITHGPPFNTKIDDLDGQGRHVGNKDYRKFIERIKPKLVVCGHLHETVGLTDSIGKSKLVHPGWEGMVIEVK